MTPEQVQISVVETIRHHSKEGSRAYYDWLRTGLTVASGALALLVGLQGSYLPKHPVSLWMLQGGWICLCLTVIAGIAALRGESAARFRAANDGLSKQFAELVARGDLSSIGLSLVRAPWYCFVAQWLFPWTFALGFAFVALFAIRNVGILSGS
jgi:hypothetical protein